jgi:transposase-like protein
MLPSTMTALGLRRNDFRYFVLALVMAFTDEDRCRRIFEAMIWPDGRVCPACRSTRSIALAGRDTGKHRARPGLYQCSGFDCRFQFTVTTRTPLHSTKLPLGIWLKAMWLMLQSDKGLSSVRLAEALGISQPTARRFGHALRLMMRGGPGCLNRLAVWISGSPLVDHAAARSGWSKYTWSGVLVPRAECGRMLL